MKNLAYSDLIFRLENWRFRLHNYKLIHNKKFIYKIKPKKSSRVKKFRGYYRKLYQSYIIVYNSYKESSRLLYEFMQTYIDDRNEKDSFYEYCKLIDTLAYDLVMNLFSRIVNGELKVKTNSHLLYEYRLVYYKLTSSDKYINYEFDLENMKFVDKLSDNKWKTIEIDVT